MGCHALVPIHVQSGVLLAFNSGISGAGAGVQAEPGFASFARVFGVDGSELISSYRCERGQTHTAGSAEPWRPCPCAAVLCEPLRL